MSSRARTSLTRFSNEGSQAKSFRICEMSKVSGCWPHGNAHLHIQLAGGQHLCHQLLACSEACLATASPLSCPAPWLIALPHSIPTPSSSAYRSLPAPLPPWQPAHHHSHPGNPQKTLSWLPSLGPGIQSSFPANLSKGEEAKGIAETEAWLPQTQRPQARL